MSDTKEYEAGNTTATHLDDEIIADIKQPCCTKRRFQLVTVVSVLITFISLCVVIPVVVIKSNNAVRNSASGVRFGSAWMPLGDKLLAEVGSQEFGESVDLSANGDFMAIGSNFLNDNTGQVEVRQYTGLTWRLVGKAIPGLFAGEHFGKTAQLSRNGKILVSGGFGSDDKDGPDKGAVRGYTLNESTQTWEQFGSNIQADVPGDHFGIALSMSADGLSWIAGADNYRGPGGEQNGYAKVYQQKNGDWRQKGSTISGLNGERTGYAVAMSGDGNTVCVGDRLYEIPDIGRRGRARCFSWNGNDWNIKGADIVGSKENGQMGYSLSLNHSGNRVVVGNRFGGENKEGSVTVFQLSGNKWNIMGSEQKSVRQGDQGGFKCELNKDGNVMAWTARGYNGDGFDTGVVRIARWLNGEWVRLGSDLLGDNAKDYFGESVALNDDGTIVVASANWGSVEYVRAFALN